MSSIVTKSIASAHGADIGTMGSNPMATVDADMRHVLDLYMMLDPRPLAGLSVEEARARPTLTTAMERLLRGRQQNPAVAFELRMIPGAAGDIRARVYRPAEMHRDETLPMILYLHGGCWVGGDLEAYDATPRALAERCRAVVVAAHYRQAPEHRFPAAYEDARAAWAWMIEHAGTLSGDRARAAVVGEDAGANLALDIARSCRDDRATVRPRHLALVSPIAAAEVTLPSRIENMQSRPLGGDDLRWIYAHLLANPADIAHPRLNPSEGIDLSGLPPTTLILPAVCPLRSEGEALADSLRRSGVWVDATVYDGVTYGFLGLARVVNKAMFALYQIARNLGEALAEPAKGTAGDARGV